MNSSFVSKLLLFLFCFSGVQIFAGGLGQRDSQNLIIAAVQFEITEEKLESIQNFQESIREAVQEAAESNADLIIFPEYTNVFLSLLPYNESITKFDTTEEFTQAILLANDGFQTIKDLFIESSDWVRILMDSIYGELAREHSVPILAGTYFHAEGNQQLTNRLVLYDETGHSVYEQDKVYLTEFEQLFLELDPGSGVNAKFQEIEDTQVGITICRDTFYSTWDTWYFATDILIDLKAENMIYELQDWEYVSGAIPARVGGTEAEYGITVHLVGEFLDLYWEGKTSVYSKTQNKIIQTTKSHDSQEILIAGLNISQNGDS